MTAFAAVLAAIVNCGTLGDPVSPVTGDAASAPVAAAFAPANRVPSVQITTPANRAVYEQSVSIQFAGSGSDKEDGILRGASLAWSTSRDGIIGSGELLSTSALSVGEHVVALTATDLQGASTTRTRTITVTTATTPTTTTTTTPSTEVNQPPTALIAEPANSSTFAQGTSVAFSGSGTDLEDGVLSGASLNWRSDRDGQIGTGISFSKLNLSVGAHLVALTAVDLQGASYTHYRNITITEATQLQTSAGSNEPTGMSVVTERGFAAATESGWGSSGRFAIVSDGTAPRSASSVGQITFPAGFTGGSAPGSTWPGSRANTRTMYVSLWMKLSSNFQNHTTGTNKLVHFNIGGLNRVFLQARGANFQPAIGLQSIAQAYEGGTSANLMPNVVTGASLTPGNWHRIEIVLVANTPGVADGSITIWQNGAKVLAKSGIMFTASGTGGKWEGMNLSPTWGGTGDTVKNEMSLRVDHFYVSGK